MLNESPLVLISADLSEEQIGRIRATAPRVAIVRAGDLKADPTLAERIEVAYPRIPPDLWRQARNLRWLQADYAGLDSLVSLPQVREHPALVTNVHIHGDCIAEHLWGMALVLTRNLGRALRRQQTGTWDRSGMTEGLATLRDRVLCVAGLGAIGTRCAEIGKAFGMRVVGISRRARASAVADEVAGPERRAEVFAQARVIMLALPLTAETRRFVGAKELQGVRGAYLFNAGRGASVDTDAVVEALRDARLRGVGLDVTDPEPLPAGHPLWAMRNAIITPHYAGNHPGYEEEAFRAFLENLGRWVRGEPLRDVVDKAAGY